MPTSHQWPGKVSGSRNSRATVVYERPPVMRNWAFGRCQICVVRQPRARTGTTMKTAAQASVTAAYRSASLGARPASQTSTTSRIGRGVGLVQTARASSAAELAHRPRQTSTSAATVEQGDDHVDLPPGGAGEEDQRVEEQEGPGLATRPGLGPGPAQRRGHDVGETDGGRDHRQLERQVVREQVGHEPERQPGR